MRRERERERDREPFLSHELVVLHLSLFATLQPPQEDVSMSNQKLRAGHACRKEGMKEGRRQSKTKRRKKERETSTDGERGREREEGFNSSSEYQELTPPRCFWLVLGTRHPYMIPSTLNPKTKTLDPKT